MRTLSSMVVRNVSAGMPLRIVDAARPRESVPAGPASARHRAGAHDEVGEAVRVEAGLAGGLVVVGVALAPAAVDEADLGVRPAGGAQLGEPHRVLQARYRVPDARVA